VDEKRCFFDEINKIYENELDISIIQAYW